MGTEYQDIDEKAPNPSIAAQLVRTKILRYMSQSEVVEVTLLLVYCSYGTTILLPTI